MLAQSAKGMAYIASLAGIERLCVRLSLFVFVQQPPQLWWKAKCPKD